VAEYARLQPGETIYELRAENISHFTPEPATLWHIGDRWRIYSGAGKPVTAVIRKLAVVVYCGGTGGWAAAIADFENPEASNLIAGLRASEYLAAPGAGLAQVSTTPIMPVEAWNSAESTPAIAELLLKQGREVVKDENWMNDQPNTRKEFADRIRRMNRTFLAPVSVAPQIRYFRWRPPGRKPLLFVEALWVGDEDNLPLFACNAVIEEGPELRLISFTTDHAEEMRMQEFAQSTWKPDETHAFLNAWKIGGRYYVLRYSSGYESYSVELTEVVPGKGLVPVGIAYGAGC
ncbi:MAG TPA: hypothetical protein VKG25_05400, partial [Bryobacteraceae bacterium]|nr:hypothetical protein [Bryobacteraceae bacterium]